MAIFGVFLRGNWTSENGVFPRRQIRARGENRKIAKFRTPFLKNRKKCEEIICERRAILSRLGELLNTLQNVHPPGGGGPGGAPRGPSWGAPHGGPIWHPQPAPFCVPPRYPSAGLFRIHDTHRVWVSSRLVLTHTDTLYAVGPPHPTDAYRERRHLPRSAIAKR